MNSSRPPRFINLIISLECVLLAAFLILLSPLGDLISNSVPAGGQPAKSQSGAEIQGEAGAPGETVVPGGTVVPGEAAVPGETAAPGETGIQGEAGESQSPEDIGQNGADGNAGEKKDFIKWVDFQVTKEAMEKAFRYDVDTCQSQIHLDWIQLLAYLGARYGGDFSKYKAADMENIAGRILDGEKIEEITADMKYYSYYLEAYRAVLGGMVGQFQVEIPVSQAPEYVLKKNQKSEEESGSGNRDGEEGQENGSQSQEDTVWVTKYGLKAFSPIAKNYPYNDYDDFGAARSYGFKRQHLGHDMMGQVGTPVICVESGYVEAIGWNQYGGWRLGIRSFDGKRYYYYAHLRKNFPYHKSLKEGTVVQAGDVIGYLGRTGYSRTENTNNIDDPHLHFGIQLIFDESQKDGNNEIWIDCYEIVKFLAMNRGDTVKKQETKEYYRKYQMVDPAIPGGPTPQKIPSEGEGQASDGSQGTEEEGSRASEESQEAEGEGSRVSGESQGAEGEGSQGSEENQGTKESQA